MNNNSYYLKQMGIDVWVTRQSPHALCDFPIYVIHEERKAPGLMVVMEIPEDFDFTAWKKGRAFRLLKNMLLSIGLEEAAVIVFIGAATKAEDKALRDAQLKEQYLQFMPKQLMLFGNLAYQPPDDAHAVLIHQNLAQLLQFPEKKKQVYFDLLKYRHWFAR